MTEYADETVTVRCQPCPVCQEAAELIVLKRDLERYRAGAKVQHAFPEMTAPMRELLISGTHPSCWEVLWGPEE